MKTISLLILIALFVLSNLNSIHAGQFKIWEDEEGVTHIEIENNKSRKTSYTPPKPNSYKKQIKLKHDYKSKLQNQERIKQKAWEKFQNSDEYKKTQKEYEKKKADIKFNSAEKRYKYLKSREQFYVKKYHEAKDSADRGFWENKLEEVREAETKYFKLKSKR
jgi:hypothetical protein